MSSLNAAYESDESAADGTAADQLQQASNTQQQNDSDLESASDAKGSKSATPEASEEQKILTPLSPGELKMQLSPVMDAWNPEFEETAQRGASSYLKTIDSELKEDRRLAAGIEAYEKGDKDAIQRIREEAQKTLSSGRQNYSWFMRIAEVQVFPEDLQARWDDCGCLLLILFLTFFSSLLMLMIIVPLVFHLILHDYAVDSLLQYLTDKSFRLAVFIYCSLILLSVFGMCLCGLHTQLMAARKRQFGSLQRTKMLVRLMHGKAGWTDPQFQQRLRREERRRRRILDRVADRLEEWEEKKELRTDFLRRQKFSLMRVQAKREAEASRPVCAIL